MKTRSKPKPKSTSDLSATPESRKSLSPDTNPPHLFVLPESIKRSSTVITLAHPRSGLPTRYCFCPHSGIYEFTRIAPSLQGYQSWFLQPVKLEKLQSGDAQGPSVTNNPGVSPPQEDSPMRNGYVSKSAEIFIATPVDPLFLTLPALSPKTPSSKTESTKLHFLSSDDLLESLYDSSKHLQEITANAPMRIILERRIAAVSDTVDVGDQTMYRLNLHKLCKELVEKAEIVVSNGLPPSMEETFIARTLEVPMLAMKREESTASQALEETESAVGALTPDMTDSQSSGTSLLTGNSQSGASTTIISSDVTEDSKSPNTLLNLQRLRTVLLYMISTYMPSHLSKELKEILCSPQSPVDFTILDQHLAYIAKLKVDAIASRSFGDFTRKRGLDDDDDDAAEARAEKKRLKLEEEKRKKAGGSRGLNDLKKADITGMKKMSAFFTKIPVKKK